MKKAKCPFCPKVIEAYTEHQAQYMLKQHILANHPEHIVIKKWLWKRKN